MFEDLIEWAKNLLSLFLQVPNSTIFTFSVSFILNLVMAIANRLLVDVNQLRENDLKIKGYMKERNEAEKRGDRRALKKLRRMEFRMNKLQTLNAKERSKVSLLFMVPFMIVYLILNAVFLGSNIVELPFVIPFVGSIGLSFAWWYIICHFTLYTMLSRLFGLTYESE